MDPTTIAALAFLVKKFVDVLKMASSKDMKGFISQLLSWVVGILIFYVASRTQWAAALVVSGVKLSDANLWSIVLLGLLLGSFASVSNDVVKRVEKKDTNGL